MAEATAPLCEKMPTGPGPGLNSLTTAVVAVAENVTDETQLLGAVTS